MVANANAPVNMYAPENYGQIGTGVDGALINQAIAALVQTGQAGAIWLSQRYVLEQSIVVPPGPAVKFIFAGGIMNRNVFPPVFNGAYIQPGPSFPPNTPLIIVGTNGSVATNPHGTYFETPRLSGITPQGNTVTGCVGIQVNDTIDVHLLEPSISNFDRTGGTGKCCNIVSSATQTCVGFQVYGGIFSNSGTAVFGDGAGFTDYRLIGTLYHSNNGGINAGPTAGGGGGQIIGNHFVFAGTQSGTFAYQNGSQTGDYTIVGNYFDRNGVSPTIVLTNAKGKISDNHFLADPNCTGPLVTLNTVNQELVFRGNQCNGNGSGMTALFKMLAGAGGAPTTGVYDGNSVYGTAASLVAVFIDKNNVAVPATNTATTYVGGNVFGP